MDGGGRPSSPALASPLDNDDLLSELLLRLAPAPSSLLRASLVCKRWLRLVSGKGFRRRFRSRHHRNAPLLGFFAQLQHSISFTPTLEPPNRIPSNRFSSVLDNLGEYRILCCRHGLVLLLNPTRLRLLVWDPSSARASLIYVPRGFDGRTKTEVFNGAVLRDAGDVDRDGHLGHFQVYLVSTNEEGTRAFVCSFSSEAGRWSKPISAACSSSMVPTPTPGTLVRRSLYWALEGDSHSILEFDLDNECLKVIHVTLVWSSIILHYCIWVTPLEGGVGVIVCLHHEMYRNIKLWKRSSDPDSDAGCEWVLERTFWLDDFLPRSSHEGSLVDIVGIAEDCDAFYLQTKTGVFMVHMESMLCKKVSELSDIHSCHSFTSVYTPDLGTNDQDDGNEPPDVII